MSDVLAPLDRNLKAFFLCILMMKPRAGNLALKSELIFAVEFDVESSVCGSAFCSLGVSLDEIV